ncbi:hypothetical protein [Candidatus Parabeggiatoa sp. HSG14]|uniref:hypothetical protein n=1 Tax=Candidatus Parabeggiatoa sp. HSG14 TaxID=3055593 RepID=UPI0025A75409|nr:hypothetical protein [Thiotrichales bacterium HSG14]
MKRFNKFLSIKLIQVILLFSLMIIAVLITAHFIIKSAEFQAQYALNDKIQNHLIAIRDTKKVQIESYFQRLFHQIKLYAHLKEITEAMRDFKEAFPKFKNETQSATVFQLKERKLQQKKYRHVLAKYYNNEFVQAYNRLNIHCVPDMANLLNQLDNNSIALQYHYVVAHPNSLNHKIELSTISDASSYTRLHYLYHNNINELKKIAKIENIFLIDSDTGMIVYSVNKTLEFATSLIDGAYAKNGLGKTFKKATLATRDEVVLVDFSPYLPAYDNYKAFLGTPLFDDEKKIGVLVFQLAIDNINEMMTDGKTWRVEKYGRTGETYLVAGDATMRNDSRFLVEDKEDYLLSVSEIGLAHEIVSTIDIKNTSVGLQTIDNPSTTFSNIHGFDFYEDYHGEFVFSAYTSLDIPGLQWAIFSTLQEEEALEPLEKFIHQIKSGATHIVIIVLVIGLISILLILPSNTLVVTRAVGNTEISNHPTPITKTYSLEQLIEHINKLK